MLNVYDRGTFEAAITINPVSNQATKQQNEATACETKDCCKTKTTQLYKVESNGKIPHPITLHKYNAVLYCLQLTY